jgi:hypothetical protein
MHRFIPAMTIPIGARVAEVGVRHHARRYGSSKYGLSRTYKVALDLFVIKTILAFSRRPLASFSGAALAAGACAIATTLAGYVGAQPGGEGSVVMAAVVGLLVALCFFLVSLGVIVTVIHQAPDFMSFARRPVGSTSSGSRHD